MNNEEIRRLLLGAPQSQRTAKAARYERYKAALKEVLLGMTEEDRLKAGKLNKEFLRGLASPTYRPSHLTELEKVVTPGLVHVDTTLAQISVMYANPGYIGEELLPGVPVSKRSDVYYIYSKRDRLAYPEDEITGNRGSTNELTQNRSTDNYSVKNYGYKNHLALETIQNQDAPLNEMVDAVEQIAEGIAFMREKRQLALLVAAGSYAGNTAAATLAWDDASGGSIVADMLAARAAMWSGFGATRKIGFCSLQVWNEGIAPNPEIHDLYRNQREGLPVTSQVAAYFRLDDILISEAREDTANEGQTASYARMMTGLVFGMVSVASSPTVRSAHFGSTFRMQGTPFTSEWTDPDIGVQGGVYVRTAVSEQSKIVAGDAGFLITGAVT